MATRDDKARLRILESYARAKRLDPTLTQGEFMMKGAPGAEHGLTLRRKKDNKQVFAPGHFKNEDSAARYFRKLKTGERTGAAMERESKRGPMRGLFQVRAKLAGEKYVSANITVANAGTTFDAPAAQAELMAEHRPAMRDIVKRYREKYGMEAVTFDPDAIDVRRISTQHAPIRFRMALGEDNPLAEASYDE